MSGFFFSEQNNSEPRPSNGGTKSAHVEHVETVARCGALDADCACSLTRRAARSVTQLYDVVLAPLGMKATQFVLLRAISEAGEIAQWQLSKDLSIAVETLTRRLATMRRAGWIELHSGTDRREHLYTATPRGQQQLETALPYWYRAQERLREQLGEEGWKETQACLDRLAVAAERSLTARVKNLPPVGDA
ncbi:MAG TPA: MarR family winged helix-turn-helix transcriptional regulator [Terriglobales bacterium]|nr:MarR family winged helix-turn-helix transcriptional regulator [Terriglobales bacterium]